MMSRIRISTGIILYIFVLGHLLNLSLGLVSIDLMESARPVIMGPWSNPVGGIILLVSFLTHAGLGLWSLYRRNTLLMNWRDGSQALLGMAIIPLLLPHIMGVGVGPALTGLQPTFTWVLAVYWLFAPGLGIQQVLALIVIWVHGCYGLLLWLHVQERLGAMVGLIWPLVVAVPMAALLGFVEAGKTMFVNRDDAVFMAPVREAAALYEPAGDQLWKIHNTSLWIYAGLLILVLAARFFRVRRQAGMVAVHYGETVTIRRKAGLSLLELARGEEMPHAGLCGARGRCGSCAVRVLEGADGLSAMSAREADALARTHADQGARLACQAMPLRGEIRVEPLYDARILPGEYRAMVHQKRRLAGRMPHGDDEGPERELPEPARAEPDTAEPNGVRA